MIIALWTLCSIVSVVSVGVIFCLAGISYDIRRVGKGIGSDIEQLEKDIIAEMRDMEKARHL